MSKKQKNAKAKQQRKTPKKQVMPISFGERIKQKWQQNSPSIKFLAKFGLFMLVFYSIWATSFFQNTVVAGIAEIDAILTSLFLNIFGLGTTAVGDSVKLADFAINIKGGCDGLEATALFMAAVVAFPTKWVYKWKGILSGSLFLFLANLLRIISLFIIGLYFPVAFDFMHLEFWQVVFILLAVACWLFWITWALKLSQQEAAKQEL